MNNNFDISKIKSEVKSKHEEFIKSFGLEIDKSNADKQLVLERVFAKIVCIVKTLNDYNIIDSITTQSDGHLKKITLSKIGSNNSIHVDTDGMFIVLYSGGLKYCFIDFGEYKLYSNIFDDSFDWNIFANDLLDFIHVVIYSKKNALTLKVFHDLVNGTK